MKIENRILPVAILFISVGSLILLAARAWFVGDMGYDSWAYHLPWASRLGEVIDVSIYQWNGFSETRFQGFPILAEYLQGQLWRITDRPESSNLIGFFSLLVFIGFTHYYLRIDWRLVTVSLLAIPLVQIHASIAYVDLVSNVPVAIVLLVGYKELVVTKRRIPFHIMLLSLTCAAIAANSKPQMVFVAPLTLMPLLFAIFLRGIELGNGSRHKRTVQVASLLVVALAIVFFPARNVLIHGNPLYPIQVKLDGLKVKIFEPHQRSNALLADQRLMGENKHAQPIRWLLSVLETDMDYKPGRWSVGSARPPGSDWRRKGGYHGIYIVCLMLWFAVAASRLPVRQRILTFSFILCLSLATSFLPGSHLLRYYLFWPLVLIGLTGIVLKSNEADDFNKYLKVLLHIIVLAGFLSVVILTRASFLNPFGRSTEEIARVLANKEVLEEIQSQPKSCVLSGWYSRPFYYAPYFHDGHDYAIRQGPVYFQDEELVAKECVNLPRVFLDEKK